MMSSTAMLEDVFSNPAAVLLAASSRVALWSALLVVGLVLWKLSTALRDYYRVKKGLAGIPTARGENWLLGHAIALLRARTPWDQMLEWLVDNQPIVRWRLLLRNCLVVRDPLILRRIFQTNQRMYEKDLDTYDTFLPILGTGLVTSNGRLWQQQRQLMMPTLRVDILDDIIGLAKDLTDSLSKKLESFRCTGRTIDMEIEFRRITLQVIGAAVLSLSSEECDRVFPELYLEAIEECNKRIMQRWRKFLPIPAFFQFQDKIRRLDKYIKTICRERWRKRKQEGNKGTGDILDRILQAIEENGGKWNSGLETQLCYEIKTFLLAGHETSAEMLTWALCELTQHEKYLDRVVEEADSVFGAQEAIPPRRAVDGMTFTLAVLKEVLRCHTLVPIVTRMFVGDEDELMGRKIPKGTMVVTHLEGTHKLYKDPLKFDPHRFLPGGEYDQFDEVIRPFMFVPFIQGPRNCLGQHLALLEGRVVLSLLLKRFRFKPVRNGPAKPRGVIPVCPEGGMPVYVN